MILLLSITPLQLCLVPGATVHLQQQPPAASTSKAETWVSPTCLDACNLDGKRLCLGTLCLGLPDVWPQKSGVALLAQQRRSDLRTELVGLCR